MSQMGNYKLKITNSKHLQKYKWQFPPRPPACKLSRRATTSPGEASSHDQGVSWPRWLLVQGGLLLFTSWQLQLCARRNFPSSLSISWSDKFLCKNVECDWQPQEPELRDRDYIMADLNRWTSTSPLLFRHFYPIPLSADTSRSFGQRQSSHCLDHQGVQNVCHSVRGCIQMFSSWKIKRWTRLAFQQRLCLPSLWPWHQPHLQRHSDQVAISFLYLIFSWTKCSQRGPGLHQDYRGVVGPSEADGRHEERGRHHLRQGLDSHLAFFQFWILSFPGSDREADPPAMPDRGRPLPVQRARQGEHLPSVSLCRFDKPRFETDEKCSRCETTFFDRNWLSFSDLDPRVRTLGYMVKLFAKVAFSNFQEGQW